MLGLESDTVSAARECCVSPLADQFQGRSYKVRIKGLLAWALVAAVVALGGCASGFAPAPAEMGPGVETGYLVGPGDTVNIVVWRNPELSMTVPVRPDGKITTPLVEDLPASGRTATQLARDIETALGKFIQSPVVTVIV